MTPLPIVHVAALLGVVLVVLVAAKLVLEWALGIAVDAALFEADNAAVALVAAGHYGGVTAILWSALRGEEATIVGDVLSTAVYGGFGLALLGAALRFAGPVLLPGLRVKDELVRDRNSGTGIAVGGATLASGLVAAGAMQGSAPGGLVLGLASTLGAFLLGQAALALATRLYGRLVGFDAHAEIRKDNAAAGCALAGAFVGNGVLLAWGVSGDLDPTRIGATLLPLGRALLLGVVLVPAVRLVVSRLFFAGIPFRVEICQDRNVAAGVVELVAHVGLAVLLVGVLS